MVGKPGKVRHETVSEQVPCAFGKRGIAKKLLSVVLPVINYD